MGLGRQLPVLTKVLHPMGTRTLAVESLENHKTDLVDVIVPQGFKVAMPGLWQSRTLNNLQRPAASSLG